MSHYYTFACRRNRRRQKAENLAPAERVKFGKPLRAKPGVGPQSLFVTAPDSPYVIYTNALNHGQRLAF